MGKVGVEVTAQNTVMSGSCAEGQGGGGVVA